MAYCQFVPSIRSWPALPLNQMLATRSNPAPIYLNKDCHKVTDMEIFFAFAVLVPSQCRDAEKILGPLVIVNIIQQRKFSLVLLPPGPHLT